MPKPIITSLLDTDLYKFTMMQCVFHHFPDTLVRYRFISRKQIDLSAHAALIQQEIAALCQLTLNDSELAYLSTLPYFKPDFIAYLQSFQLQQKHITLSHDPFEIIIEGPWLETILFEVPLLAIISESYYQATFSAAEQDHMIHTGREHLEKKIQYLLHSQEKIHFSDFGTRRRFSRSWQHEVIQTLRKYPEYFDGTSNIYFAQQFQLRPIGTMAHEYLQAFQVLAPEIPGCQRFALQTWLKEYPDALGIALTDVLTMDIFLSEFDQDLAQQYIGLRQDSGDPLIWGEKALAHYKKLGIDARNKLFVFSDSLTFAKAVEIHQHFKNRCKPLFGIGTYLTNDMGQATLDIVIKMTHTNHQPVVKISDSKGKIVCEDAHYLQKIKSIFALQD